MVAHLMELSNLLQRYRARRSPAERWDEAVRLMLLMLAPAAPHIAKRSGRAWPRRGARPGPPSTPRPGRRWTRLAATENEREVPVQVNGKLRDKVTVPVGIGEAELERADSGPTQVIAALEGKTPVKVIHRRREAR